MAGTGARTDVGEKLRGTAQSMTPDGGSARAQITTDTGKTRIAAGVVAKLAGIATREIPGVQSMGTGVTRRLGQLRNMLPGSSEASDQGVSVEVGEREAAIDLDIVTWYGQSILDISGAVRRNVIERINSTTGLKVVEVNINVDDVFVEGDGDGG
jgi:uncharacterized alkaline shock family protein YloU